ncbi:MAG: hypothetical protein WKG03_19075, partial [Telluria sp.]
GVKQSDAAITLHSPMPASGGCRPMITVYQERWRALTGSLVEGVRAADLTCPAQDAGQAEWRLMAE